MTRMNAFRSLTLLLAIAFLSNCDNPSDGGMFALQEVQTYGEEEARSGATAGAGMLSSVRGIVELADGSIAVLDGGWRKIVVFSRNGDVERIIPVPEGEGPGEVILPRDLTISPEGHLGVLDHVRQQVVWYNQDTGEPENLTPLPISQPLRVRATSVGLWVTDVLLSGSARPVASFVNFQGEMLEQLASRDAEEIVYSGTVVLAVDAQERPLLPNPIPGLWTYWGSAGGSRHGMGLVESSADESVRSVAVMGIAEFQNEFVFLTWVTLSPDDPPEFHRYMAIFSFDGNLIEVIEGDMIGSELFVSAESGNLFMAYDMPFPHVKELQLKPTGASD